MRVFLIIKSTKKEDVMSEKRVVIKPSRRKIMVDAISTFIITIGVYLVIYFFILPAFQVSLREFLGTNSNFFVKVFDITQFVSRNFVATGIFLGGFFAFIRVQLGIRTSYIVEEERLIIRTPFKDEEILFSELENAFLSHSRAGSILRYSTIRLMPKGLYKKEFFLVGVEQYFSLLLKIGGRMKRAEIRKKLEGEKIPTPSTPCEKIIGNLAKK